MAAFSGNARRNLRLHGNCQLHAQGVVRTVQ